MSGSSPFPASGSRQSTTNRSTDDPLAADKRTLVIALIAMVVLVSVGVVSAALFTGSACQDVSPSPVTAGAASAEVDEALATAFPDGDPDVIAGIRAQLDAAVAQLGAVTGVAVVDGADGLVATADGVAAVGSTTSLLPSSGNEVTASADVGRGVVVGSGDALASLARVNDLTGQVDAFATIDATAAGGLAEIGCVDTATVGTPLAFELDAADGRLLLFRAEEDGDDAELELRDPREGRLWFSRVDVGAAPPGVTGERIDGRLGADLAVLVRRTSPAEDIPLVTAVDRADGSLRWQLGRDAFRSVPIPATSVPDAPADGSGASVLRDDAPQRLELLALDDEQAVIAITDARGDDAVAAGGTDALGPSVGPGHVVALDVRDGTPRWQRPLAAGVRVLTADSGAAVVWLVLADGDQMQLVGLDAAGDPLGASSDSVVADSGSLTETPDTTSEPGPDRSTADGPGRPAAVTVLPARAGASGPAASVVAVLDGRLVVLRDDGHTAVAPVTEPTTGVGGDGGPLWARDVVALGDRVHVLFAGPVSGAGQGSGTRDLLVTFAAE